MQNSLNRFLFRLVNVFVFVVVWIPFGFLVFQQPEKWGNGFYQGLLQGLTGWRKSETDALWNTFWFTVSLGFQVSIYSCLLGGFVGFVLFVYFNGKEKLVRVLQLGLQVPFLTPPLFYAFCYLVFVFQIQHSFAVLISALPFLETAIGLKIAEWWSFFVFSPSGVVLVLLGLYFPWVAIQIWGICQRSDVHEWNAAATLGAGVIRRIVCLNGIRLIKGLFLQALQIFVWTVTSFSIVLMIGGGPRSQTLEMLIYRSARLGDWNLGEAGSAAVLLAVIVLLPWSILFFLERLPSWSSVQKRANVFGSDNSVQYEGLGKSAAEKKNFASLLFIFLTLTLLIWVNAPVIYSVLKSITALVLNVCRSEFSQIQFLSTLVVPFKNSIEISMFACGLAAVMSFCAVNAKPGWKSEWLLESPAAVSGFTLGLSWLLFRNRLEGSGLLTTFLNGFLFGEVGNLALIVVLLSVQILPFYYWNLKNIYRDRSLLQLELADTMGANAFQKIAWILLPRFWNGGFPIFLAGVAFCFAEISILSLLSTENFIPFSMALSRLYGQYQFDLAVHANGLILFLFFLFAWIGRKNSRTYRKWGNSSGKKQTLC